MEKVWLRAHGEVLWLRGTGVSLAQRTWGRSGYRAHGVRGHGEAPMAQRDWGKPQSMDKFGSSDLILTLRKHVSFDRSRDRS